MTKRIRFMSSCIDKQVWLHDVFEDFVIKNSGLVEKGGMKIGKRVCNSDSSVAIGSSHVGSDLSGLLVNDIRGRSCRACWGVLRIRCYP